MWLAYCILHARVVGGGGGGGVCVCAWSNDHSALAALIISFAVTHSRSLFPFF